MLALVAEVVVNVLKALKLKPGGIATVIYVFSFNLPDWLWTFFLFFALLQVCQCWSSYLGFRQ